MALTTQPREREKVRPEISEARDRVTGDLPPHLVEKIKVTMRRKLAKRFCMPEDTSLGDLRIEEHRRDKVQRYRLRNDATWGRIILSAFRRSKDGIIEFPEPGKIWKDEIGENLRQQRMQKLGLPQSATWEDIEIAIATHALRKKLGLPPNASLRNASFAIK